MDKNMYPLIRTIRRMCSEIEFELMEMEPNLDRLRLLSNTIEKQRHKFIRRLEMKRTAALLIAQLDETRSTLSSLALTAQRSGSQQTAMRYRNYAMAVSAAVKYIQDHADVDELV